MWLDPTRWLMGMSTALTMIDRFSRFVDLAPLQHASAVCVADAFFSRWIDVHGVPRLLCTDAGSHFKNEWMAQVCRLLRVTHHVAVAYHHESMGAVERANRVLRDGIVSLVKEEPEWPKLLPSIAFAMNTSVNRSIGITPFLCTHGYHPRLVVDAAVGALRVVGAAEPLVFARILVKDRVDMWKRVRDAEHAAYVKARDQYMRHRAGKDRQFTPGDYVMVWSERVNKMQPRWMGPFVVAARHAAPEDMLYQVQDLNTGSVHWVHVQRLHAFNKGKLCHCLLCVLWHCVATSSILRMCMSIASMRTLCNCM